MSTLDEKIENWALGGESTLMIARRIYYLCPTAAFTGDPDRELEIYRDVSEFFNIPFNSIQIVGSAKTGFSLIKNTLFSANTSDIDIAVIDQSLFMNYVEIAFTVSNGYRRKDLFPKDRNGNSTLAPFKEYLAKGMFRPDLMPYCPERARWISFFSKLSGKHSGFCAGMSAAIYASSTFFEWKQKNVIEKFIASRGQK